MCEKNEIQNRKRQIRLIGIGMGSAASTTREGAEAIEGSDCLIGARRMLEAAGGKAAAFCEYRAEEILSYIEAHPEYGKNSANTGRRRSCHISRPIRSTGRSAWCSPGTPDSTAGRKSWLNF